MTHIYPIEEKIGKMRNMGSKSDMVAQARDIETFWFRRGYMVKTWLEEYHRTPDMPNKNTVYSIRSDMVNGVPV